MGWSALSTTAQTPVNIHYHQGVTTPPSSIGFKVCLFSKGQLSGEMYHYLPKYFSITLGAPFFGKGQLSGEMYHYLPNYNDFFD